MSFVSNAFLVLSISVSTFAFSSPLILSPKSFNVFSLLYTKLSALFLTSISSFFFLSSSACASASLTALSISSSVKFVDAVIETSWLFPVAISFADTWTIPFASISNVTSIWGTPLGAAGIPVNWNLPNVLLYAAISLSPCNTWTSTDVWPSAAVENICDFLVGIVVFLSINFVNTPPYVSIPNDNGVTSNNTKSLTSPDNTPPWIDAPIATHSSGFIPLSGSFPVILLTISCTAGTLVEPPTNNTLWISFAVNPASFNAWLTGPAVASTKSWINSSNLDLVNVTSKCFGPVASAVINGKLICVCWTPDNSILAFSAASFNLCIAILSDFKSIPFDFLNSSTR